VYWNAEQPWKPKADLTPAIGSEFDIVRCLPPGKWVFVGAGSVRGITGSLGEGFARALAPKLPTNPGHATEFEVQSSNLYWRPMGGDVILPRQYKIATRQRITVKETLAYETVFMRENGTTFTAELSESGKRAIAAVVNKTRGASGRIGVEVFSNRTGNRSDLQEDTQTRANIIARHIMQSFGLRDSAVVAIGLGSSGLPSGARETQAWPLPVEATDGVVIRIMPE
jgi:hypothetical protein